MHARARTALALTVPLVAAGLTGCAGSDEFCTGWKDAGGTLATVGPFQVGLSPAATTADIESRLAVMDAVAPPEDVAQEWAQVHDLYTEVVEIARSTADDSVVVDPRALEIVGELGEPADVVSAHVAERCF